MRRVQPQEFDHLIEAGSTGYLPLFYQDWIHESYANLEEVKKLSFSYAESRYQWGRLKMCEPSRFLLEVDPHFLNVSNMLHGAPTRESVSPVTSFARNLTQRKPAPTPSSTTVSHTPSEDFVASDTFDLKEGDKVEHLKFGFGEVTRMDVNGTDRKATVNFNLVGEKTLLLSFAKLRILK